ncbi:hypothetical protein [Actinomadura sp. 6N118]|uniref:hypothetical protein n=1 Tax=Actinomadura sp. 6N118 TaxID=3375151 RepID=UPI00379D8250
MLIRALDGDQAARQDGRDELLKAAPTAWDEDLDAGECAAWQSGRPVIAPHGEA